MVYLQLLIPKQSKHALNCSQNLARHLQKNPPLSSTALIPPSVNARQKNMELSTTHVRGQAKYYTFANSKHHSTKLPISHNNTA